MTNWGRWGTEDERGAANRFTAEATIRGLACARQGHTISLAIPLDADSAPRASLRAPVQHFMTRDGGDYAAGLRERPGFGFADDYLLVACHGTTHLDALSHIWQDGLMWNGFSANAVTSRGAARCGIEKVGPIVTRAIYLDLVPEAQLGLEPGYAISPQELGSALQRTGVHPQPGDALLIRTGWLERWRAGTADIDRWPGVGADCADWIDHFGFALVGADNIAVEPSPSGDPACTAPLHVSLMRDRGIYLMELLDLEELRRRRAVELLLIVSPLPIVGGVGSPVAPVAVV
jgi:kynurenine formamidase